MSKGKGKGMDKEHEAISRLQLASKMSERYYNQPLLICNSGGKDSLVCLELAKRAGIDYEVQHSHTTADMPDTVYYVRKQMKDLEAQGVKCTINYPTYKGGRISMWSLIPSMKIPPIRIFRYCCRVLKETAGANRAIVTGVRAKESVKRKKRNFAETNASKDKRQSLSFEDVSVLYEETENRQFVEHDQKFKKHCQIKGETIFNPIIDWTDEEVWDFIESENLEINPCYNKYQLGRCGCIGCPMAGKKRWKEFALFPKYRDMYLMAFKNMLTTRKAEGKETTLWKNEWDVFFWWMEDKKEKKDKKDMDLFPGQISLFD